MVIDGMYSHHKPPTNRSRLLSGPWQMSDRLWEMNCGILGLGLSVAGTICVTGALKNATGKPRPDIIARYVPGDASAGRRGSLGSQLTPRNNRCNPRQGATNAAVWGLVTSEICTQTDHRILKDGFKSWPSGHASSTTSSPTPHLLRIYTDGEQLRLPALVFCRCFSPESYTSWITEVKSGRRFLS
jgi:diacylglycerol diphosphate phosphatase/phosphatidate phosphatase